MKAKEEAEEEGKDTVEAGETAESTTVAETAEKAGEDAEAEEDN